PDIGLDLLDEVSKRAQQVAAHVTGAAHEAIAAGERGDETHAPPPVAVHHPPFHPQLVQPAEARVQLPLPRLSRDLGLPARQRRGRGRRGREGAQSQAQQKSDPSRSHWPHLLLVTSTTLIFTSPATLAHV